MRMYWPLIILACTSSASTLVHAKLQAAGCTTYSAVEAKDPMMPLPIPIQGEEASVDWMDA
jgi:hypothetical protein